MRIAADEVDDPAIAEHLSICSACREFEHELAENAAALRSIEVDAAAYTALRARVMAAVEPKRRFGWLWAAAAAAVAACIAFFWLTAPFPPPEPPHLQAVVHGGNVLSALPMPVAKKKKRKTQVRRPVLLEAIKILTDDPNVVIIWLVDDKKGDSL
jgi:hypothetical protein